MESLVETFVINSNIFHLTLIDILNWLKVNFINDDYIKCILIIRDTIRSFKSAVFKFARNDSVENKKPWWTFTRKY